MPTLLALIKHPSELKILELERVKDKYEVTIVACTLGQDRYYRKRGFVTYSRKQFLSGEMDHLKFDLIIGNPPYNEASSSTKTIAGTSGNTTLYRKFVDKAFQLRTEEGTVALVIQRTGIKYAMDKHHVSKMNLDTSECWKFAAGFFISTGTDQSALDITADPIIRKTYSLTVERPFRHAIGGSYAGMKTSGKFHDDDVDNSVWGLVETPKQNTPAIYKYIVGNHVPRGPKLVFKGLESINSYTVTDLPAYVGSTCTLFFDTIADAESARMFILHNPIVAYLQKKIGNKARGLTFRYIKEFDLSQIKTGTEIPVEFGLTDDELALLSKS